VKLDHADIIKKIIRLEEGRAEIIIRVYCPFCRVKSALLLIGKTGRYECQVCHKHGKLTDLVVYFEDMFERRHRQSIQTMTERSAVDL
jgi:transposase-like protein